MSNKILATNIQNKGKIPLLLNNQPHLQIPNEQVKQNYDISINNFQDETTPNNKLQIQNLPFHPQDQMICFPSGQEIVNPEVLYCKQKIRGLNSEIKIQIQYLFILLQILIAQLPLRFTFIQLICKSNIYSSQFCENKILKPLIAENVHISEQVIRGSYVAYCGKELSLNIKFQSIISIINLLVTLIFLITANLVIFNIKYSQSNAIIYLNAIYISQTIFYLIIIALFLVGTFKCNPKFVYAAYFIGILSLSLAALQLCFSFIFSNDSTGAQIYNAVSSLASTLLIYLSTRAIKAVYTDLVKLLVLLSQIDQKQLQNCV
ncbi:transmembrane protein, putative (macronuclear) [Tetrahymena thermophila SB210]|uniref:Transmembrane protein, putative n=1 Tax=Tetrahymena thermophila (strain SB210) TaxID=312017 RepID=I7LU72_TETTS|nr:transmembrane protein, putative [Tetrahymena thermophila SB210]EAR90726.1 transmembrane protein, putative [Tetrahymena thermophila SB210]|eukprot:XP_001010971.1 transmembrane protein, putative [Tetrahymena thermophila SB210]